MDKTAYWAEYPDKDMAVIILDDGEHQEIITGDPGQRQEPGSLLKDFQRRGFVVHAFTSWLEENDEPRAFNAYLRRWRRIDDAGEGELVYPGPLAGLGQEMTS